MRIQRVRNRIRRTISFSYNSSAPKLMMIFDRNVYVAPAATKLFQGGLSKRLEIARAMESRRGSYVDSLTCEGRWPAAVCAEQLENWKERMKGAGLGWFLMSGQFDAP